MNPDGKPLGGGNLTPVVRVGNAVHRASGAWTPTIHRYLSHLESAGVQWAPRPRGLDDEGREILTFLDGDVPAYPLPEWVWNTDVLEESGTMLRQLHDASTTFDRTGAVWRLPLHEPAEVICHNDFAPHNLVFRDGNIVGAIDFDTSSPGPRIWDVAYLATRAVPLTLGIDRAVAVARSAILLAAYGSDATFDELLDVAIERLWDLAAFTDATAAQLAHPELLEHAAGYRLDAEYLAAWRG